jgi:hypothetical protein
MALLSFVESGTPSLQAQGEQRRSFFFNNPRDIPDGALRETERHERTLARVAAANMARSPPSFHLVKSSEDD